MYEILIVAILVIAAVFLGLTVLIVGNKAWRDLRARRRDERREDLEPVVAAYVRGRQTDLRQALDGVPRGMDREVVENVLMELGRSSEGAARQRVFQAFEDLGFVDDYLRILERGRNWWRRAEAAEALGIAGVGRAAPYLTRAMEDDVVSEVRFRAATALGHIGGVSAIRPLVRALSEPNRWSTIRIADILISMGSGVVEELTSCFENMNLHARCSAVDIIAAIGDPAAAPWLRRQLEAKETDVRSRAAAALGAIGDLEAGPALIEALDDTQWPVRAMAAKALGTIVDTPAVEALCAALRDREWWVRTNAAESLKLMGPVGLDALEEMLDDYDPYARHQAVLMLEESGILDEEIARLVDAEPEQRAAALSLVNRLIHAGQHGRLREIARHHADGQVRELLESLLPEELPPHAAVVEGVRP